eukprot:4166767-Amphidinium_carterae.1
MKGCHIYGIPGIMSRKGCQSHLPTEGVARLVQGEAVVKDAKGWATGLSHGTLVWVLDVVGTANNVGLYAQEAARSSRFLNQLSDMEVFEGTVSICTRLPTCPSPPSIVAKTAHAVEWGQA